MKRFEAAFLRLHEAYEALSTSGRDHTPGNVSCSDSDDEKPTPKRARPRARPSASAREGPDAAGASGQRAAGSKAPPDTPNTPAQAAQEVEERDAVADADEVEYDLSITVSWRKSPRKGSKPVTEVQRRAHARNVVSLASHHTQVWTACKLYSDSVERGTDGGGQHAHHAQGMRTVVSRGGVETAIAATEAYYRACDYHEKDVVLRVFVKEKGGCFTAVFHCCNNNMCRFVLHPYFTAFQTPPFHTSQIGHDHGEYCNIIS